MDNYEWTEQHEQEYQHKLAQKPVMRPFDPDKLPAHREATREWFRSLTPAEKFRHQIGQEPIIVD